MNADRNGLVHRGLARIRSTVPLTDPWATALFDSSQGALALIDPQGRILSANAALAKLLGRDHPLRGTLADLIAQGMPWRLSPGENEPAELRHASGHAIPVIANRIGPPGTPALIAFVPTPLDPDSAARAARLQAVGALAGGIAHDFNNLLQAIGAAGEALRQAQPVAPGAQEELDLIAGGVARGAALVRQLLAFARQQTLVPRIVAVNAAVEAIAGLLARSLGERIRLNLRLDHPGRHIRIDPGQFDQVVLNLALNARDAMPRGGTLSLSTGRRTVLAPTAALNDLIPPGRYVVLELTDTGEGIPPKVLPHIFEPFFTTRAGPGQGGTGLGLSTVQGIVRQSGGFIEVETQPGQGTTFRILFPRAEPEPIAAAEQKPAAAREPVPEHPVAASSRTLLLVEDEEPARRLAARALQRDGWTVLAATDGGSALGMAADTPDLCCIVSDLVMPGMDGVALVNAVRERLGRADLPAIIVSGYADAALRDAVAALGASFLAKPYSLRDLTACAATKVAVKT